MRLDTIDLTPTFLRQDSLGRKKSNIISNFGQEKDRQANKLHTQTLIKPVLTQNDSTNMAVYQIMASSEIKQYIVNPKTLEKLENQKLSKPSNLLGKALVSPSQLELPQSKLKRLLKRKVVSGQQSTDGSIEKFAKFFSKLSKKNNQPLNSTTKLEMIDKPNVENALAPATSFNDLLNDYVPIIFYLTATLKMLDKANKILFYDPWLMSFESKNPTDIISSRDFLYILINKILTYQESTVYDHLLQTTTSWEVLLSEQIINLYMEERQFDYTKKLVDKYNQQLIKLQKDHSTRETPTLIELSKPSSYRKRLEQKEV